MENRKFNCDLLEIRKFTEDDAEEVAALIQKNFREVNIKDYGEKAVEELCRTHNAEWVINTAGYAHMYVFCLEGRIIGCGSISSYWGSEDESILLTVFVTPQLHGRGIGRRIIETLEKDELFVRARRVEIPASITAVEFYRRFGYEFKDGARQLDKENLYRLEKFKQPGVGGQEK